MILNTGHSQKIAEMAHGQLVGLLAVMIADACEYVLAEIPQQIFLLLKPLTRSIALAIIDILHILEQIIHDPVTEHILRLSESIDMKEHAYEIIQFHTRATRSILIIEQNQNLHDPLLLKLRPTVQLEELP